MPCRSYSADGFATDDLFLARGCPLRLCGLQQRDDIRNFRKSSERALFRIDVLPARREGQFVLGLVGQMDQTPVAIVDLPQEPYISEGLVEVDLVDEILFHLTV